MSTATAKVSSSSTCQMGPKVSALKVKPVVTHPPTRSGTTRAAPTNATRMPALVSATTLSVCGPAGRTRSSGSVVVLMGSSIRAVVSRLGVEALVGVSR